VALLRNADLLFLPLHKLPAGERSRIVPGKTYEYLAAKRPILAAVPEGDARDFVVASGLGNVCAPDDVDAMAAILRGRFEEKRAGRQPTPGPAAFYQQFERLEITAKLARGLESVIRPGAAGPSPGPPS
jgi:glycosyltransferase involved in cell wall biosynthesis